MSSMAGLYTVSDDAVEAGCPVAVAKATCFGSAWPMAGTAVANIVWKGAETNVPALSNHSEKGLESTTFKGAVLALDEVMVISTL